MMHNNNNLYRIRYTSFAFANDDDEIDDTIVATASSIQLQQYDDDIC